MRGWPVDGDTHLLGRAPQEVLAQLVNRAAEPVAQEPTCAATGDFPEHCERQPPLAPAWLC